MSSEDVAARTLQKIEFVTMREDLEAIHDRTLQSFGDEFILYIKAKSGDLQLKLQYEQSKQKKFIKDVIVSLIQH